MIAYKSRDTGLLYIAINNKFFLYEDLEISDNLIKEQTLIFNRLINGKSIDHCYSTVYDFRSIKLHSSLIDTSI